MQDVRESETIVNIFLKVRRAGRCDWTIVPIDTVGINQ